jgi:uncharacterized membrane protein
MIRVGDGFFSVIVSTLLVSLLLTTGGVGVALACALTACAVYRARCSIVRMTQHDGALVRSSVLHG